MTIRPTNVFRRRLNDLFGRLRLGIPASATDK
jgi:hypothetical protein